MTQAHARTTLALALIAALVACFATGCGDEETPEPENAAPLIDEASFAITCAEVADSRFDGQTLTGINVTVTDEDEDLTRVTATVSGTIFVLAQGGEGAFSYSQSDDNSLARCPASGTDVLIRAVDDLGLVTEFTGKAP